VTLLSPPATMLQVATACFHSTLTWPIATLLKRLKTQSQRMLLLVNIVVCLITH